MPIQNAGTLLENVIVTAAAFTLLDSLEPGRHLAFAGAFAMPPLSPWGPHPQSIGISTAALQRVRDAPQPSRTDSFLNVMRACLRKFPDQGPNGALLVALAGGVKHTPLSIWVNDVEEKGHYKDALPSLAKIQESRDAILDGSAAPLTVVVCPTPYPRSIAHLSTTLAGWAESVSLGALLAFLDPNRYVTAERDGPQTSSVDHRNWLDSLSLTRSCLALHFTANNEHLSRERELASLRADVESSGLSRWVEFQRQYFVVSVASSNMSLLEALERRVLADWAQWCDTVREIKTHKLTIRRGFSKEVSGR